MKTLSIENIGFNYTDRPILSEVSFSTESGSVCGLLGPNGSGKTTLLKCINGFLKPRAGQVYIDGKSITNLSRKTIAGLIAMVPQLSTPVFSFTALQMVVMGRVARLGAFAVPSRRHYRDAAAVLEELGIGHLAACGINEMSGGERQMVLLARALFQNPKILLLDEPTAHLDFKNQYMVLDTVAAVTRKKNLTTLVTLHDPNLAARYCSQMVMLKQGRVHRSGITTEVFDSHALESMYGIKVSIENGCRGNCYVMPSTEGCGVTWH